MSGGWIVLVERTASFVYLSTAPGNENYCPQPQQQGRVVLIASYCITIAHSSGAVCESRGGRPGLSVLTSLLVSVDVKLY